MKCSLFLGACFAAVYFSVTYADTSTPTPICPPNFQGLDDTASKRTCDDDRGCIGPKQQIGFCCLTTSSGRNCYFPLPQNAASTATAATAAAKPASPAPAGSPPAPPAAPALPAIPAAPAAGSGAPPAPPAPAAPIAAPAPAPPRSKRETKLPAGCPAGWKNLGTCMKNKTCSRNVECVHRGKDGHCCPTSCGGWSCHYPHIIRNRRTGGSRNRGSGLSCPASFEGVGGKCREIECNTDEDCVGMSGLIVAGGGGGGSRFKRNSGSRRGGRYYVSCCETRCGGRNCYVRPSSG